MDGGERGARGTEEKEERGGRRERERGGGGIKPGRRPHNQQKEEKVRTPRAREYYRNGSVASCYDAAVPPTA